MKIKITTFVISPIAFALIIGSRVVHASEYTLSPIKELGENIFHDTDLSINKNQVINHDLLVDNSKWQDPGLAGFLKTVKGYERISFSHFIYTNYVQSEIFHVSIRTD